MTLRGGDHHDGSRVPFRNYYDRDELIWFDLPYVSSVSVFAGDSPGDVWGTRVELVSGIAFVVAESELDVNRTLGRKVVPNGVSTGDHPEAESNHVNLNGGPKRRSLGPFPRKYRSPSDAYPGC